MGALTVDSLPLGFRFRPTDEELITHYLKLKINGRHSEVEVISEIDVCKWEPWDLPGLSVIKTDDPEWFFFCPRDRKYPNGQRSNRATEAGYWKATGKDRTIRTRKTGSGNTATIGMKKTLVFYRGRAPRGERTNWIMHEYRPTLKELDGTGPGQSAFVLCRLFRKPEEKTEVVNYDEVEPTGYSPLATKSSPGDTSSDLVQDIATSDVPVGDDLECVKRWLTDIADNMTPSTVAPVDSSSNSHITSDIEDHAGEAAATEAYTLLEETSQLYVPTPDQVDSNLFSPTQSHIHSGLTYFMDSPYANDFGNDLTGFNFMDGTSEQDVSLAELLGEVDEAFNNYDEFGQELISQNNIPVGSETFLLGQSAAGNFDVQCNGAYSVVDSEMVQAQHHAMIGAPIPNTQASLGFGVFDNSPFGQDALSANSATGTSFGVFNSMEDSNNQMNSVNSSSNAYGTGIKIKPRQSRGLAPSSVNVAAQGTAPRRLRLAMSNTRYSNEEGEVQSVVKEARDTEEQTGSSDEIQKDCPPNYDSGNESRDSSDQEELIPASDEILKDSLLNSENSSKFGEDSSASEESSHNSDKIQKGSPQPDSDNNREYVEDRSSHLRLRPKQDVESRKRQIRLSPFAHAPPTHWGLRSYSIYIVGMTIVLVSFVVFAGISISVGS